MELHIMRKMKDKCGNSKKKRTIKEPFSCSTEKFNHEDVRKLRIIGNKKNGSGKITSSV